MYEVFEHTADLGLRVRSDTPEGLFADAATGLFATIVDLEGVRPAQERAFRIEGTERDYLLFDWLNELLYTFDSEHVLFCEFDVWLDDKGLTARARGEPLDQARHELDHEVKAITYHGLTVQQNDGLWMAEVIVDI
jgi:SHS2 domain-containing protein